VSTPFLGPDDPGYEGGETDTPRFGDRPLADRMRAFTVETSFYLAAVAERLGMSSTDFTGLTLLLTRGPLSAGALAEHTGLTTGAITGLVDRLEQGGWVRRTPDPDDRRRVIVEPILEKVADMRPLLDPMLRDTALVEARFDDRQLAAILAFVEESTAVLAHHVRELRHPESVPPGSGMPSAGPGAASLARRGRADAELVLRGIASDVTVVAADLGDVLCVADFGRRGAHLSEKDGRVEIGRGGWAGGVTEAGRVVIHRDVRWKVTVRGGASHLVIDLRGARLASLAVTGGANTVEIDLPVPEGLVPVRLHGGVSHMLVTRPDGVPVVPTLRGGSTTMKVDGQSVPGYGRVIGLVGGAPAAGYSIDVKGGASSVEVVVAPALGPGAE
jgi:DNA-binding MarR family transcriptional regulator